MKLQFSSQRVEFQFINPEHEAIESTTMQQEISISHVAEVKGTYIVRKMYLAMFRKPWKLGETQGAHWHKAAVTVYR
jgi:hypothetical protein